MGNVQNRSEKDLKIVQPAEDRRELYEFGPYRLEASGPFLLRDGEPVALTPKASETLLALVRRAGDLVTKEELIRTVWPDTFVEESIVANNVWTVRKALEDNGATSRYIETIPKRGYRFVAAVRRVVATGATVGEKRESHGARPSWILTTSARWFGVAGLIVLIGAIAVMAVRARPSAPRHTAKPPLQRDVVTHDITQGKTRLVVLPFENLTRRPDDDWLGNAFSDSITVGLQSLDNLILVSRSGIAHAYRAQSLRATDRLEPDSIARLSRMLGVRFYVHGSYQRIGDELRVVARLVEIGPGAIKVQESLTDRMSNLLHLEEALARRFAESLKGGGSLAPRRPETTSLAAHRAITEGRGFYASSRWPSANEAFKRAVDLDSESAEAWALLAKSYARLASPSGYTTGPYDDFRSRALAAARRAVELDPSSYEAHVAVGLAYRAAAQVEPWRVAARKAIALNPRFAEAYALMGDSYSEGPFFGCERDRDGRLAVSYFRQALRVDPSVIAYHHNLINHLRYAGKPEEALRQSEESLRLHSDRSIRGVRTSRAQTLIDLGDVQGAERLLRQVISDGGPRREDHVTLGTIHLKQGRLKEAAMSFDAIPEWGYSWKPEIARAYLQAGLPQQALQHLDEGLKADPRCAQWLLKTESSYWDDIRANPQARTLLESYLAR